MRTKSILATGILLASGSVFAQDAVENYAGSASGSTPTVSDVEYMTDICEQHSGRLVSMAFNANPENVLKLSNIVLEDIKDTSNRAGESSYLTI